MTEAPTSRHVHKSGDLIDSGSPAYKIVTSEKWSIVFPLSEEDAALYNDKTVLRVVFRDYSLTAHRPPIPTFTGRMGLPTGNWIFQNIWNSLSQTDSWILR